MAVRNLLFGVLLGLSGLMRLHLGRCLLHQRVELTVDLIALVGRPYVLPRVFSSRADPFSSCFPPPGKLGRLLASPALKRFTGSLVACRGTIRSRKRGFRSRANPAAEVDRSAQLSSDAGCHRTGIAFGASGQGVPPFPSKLVCGADRMLFHGFDAFSQIRSLKRFFQPLQTARDASDLLGEITSRSRGHFRH